MKPEYNVTCFTAPAGNAWCGNMSEEKTHNNAWCSNVSEEKMHNAAWLLCYCDGYPATKKDQQWKLPKKSAKIFTRHMLLGE